MDKSQKSSIRIVITTVISILFVVGIMWLIFSSSYSPSSQQQNIASSSADQQSVPQQEITTTPTSTTPANQKGSNNNTTSDAENDITNTPTSIDQKSVNQGWLVIPLGASPEVQFNTSFSDTITDLGQTIPLGSLSWDPLAGPNLYTTTGKYIQVNLQVNNLGVGNEGLEIVFAGVFDQAGRYYAYQMGNSTCGNYGATEGTQTLSPDIPCIMNALFEVGQDSNSFTVKLYIKKDF
jgi:hypothetical protein